MYRAYLPKALALTLLTAGLTVAGAQQSPTVPDGGSPAATAPVHRHHAPDPQRQAARLGRRLNLTSDQTAKVEPILAARDQQMQALFGNTQLSREDRHQQMRSIHQQTEQQLSGVLSPDQMAQLKAMRHRGRFHHEGDPNSGQAPTA